MKQSLLTTAFAMMVFYPEPSLAFTKGPCTDGTDCYCDCVENTPGTGADVGAFASTACQTLDIPIDTNLLICEDFEDPLYEEPLIGNNTWNSDYGSGVVNCTASCVDNLGTFEGDSNACRNILQRNDALCALYDAGDDDLNETGGHPTLDGTWDGCQTWGYPIKSVDTHPDFCGRRGGAATNIRDINGGGAASGTQTSTFSVTMAKKFSSNHYLGNVPDENIKGDRYREMIVSNGDTPTFMVPFSMSQGIPNTFCCAPIGEFPPNDIDLSLYTVDVGGFAALIKSTAPTSPASSNDGIDARGQCCDADCFADSGTMVGLECHSVSATESIRYMVPPVALWDPGTPGGAPALYREGDGDGLDEWLCIQFTFEDTATATADYRFSVNETMIIRMENYAGANDDGPIANFQWLNTHAGGGDEGNQTSVDIFEVRDNYHITESATPIPCTQIGFGEPATPGEGVTIGPGLSLTKLLPSIIPWHSSNRAMILGIDLTPFARGWIE